MEPSRDVSAPRDFAPPRSSAVAVLVQASDPAAKRGICTSLSPPDLAGVPALHVVYDRSPDEVISHYGAADLQSRSVSILSVGDRRRSASRSCGDGIDCAAATIETVPEPADLTGLAIEANLMLSEWTDDPGSVSVCFDSLTSMLDHVSLERGFRFLNDLIGQLKADGAIAHFHIDPTQHDERTINALAGLFDAVIEVHSAGEVSIRTR